MIPTTKGIVIKSIIIVIVLSYYACFALLTQGMKEGYMLSDEKLLYFCWHDAVTYCSGLRQ